MKIASLLIVDDHEVFRRGLRSLLEPFSDWRICGEAIDGINAVEQCRRLKPDIVVMDITMPQMNGLEATKLIKQERPATQIVIITQHDSPQISSVAMQSGASSFVTKSAVGSELVAAIQGLVRKLGE